MDDHGSSCLGGPSEPGMLAGVVGRVVSRPAVESVCGSSARCCGNPCESDIRAKKTRAAMVFEPLREEAQMAVEPHVGANAEQWEKPQEPEAKMVLEPLPEEALPTVPERQVSELKDELELCGKRRR